MTHRWQVTAAILLLFHGGVTAQEVITGLLYNSRLSGQAELTTLKNGTSPDTLTLPFFDDFSGTGFYPSPGRWEDRKVFINNTFSVRQITNGVATFDCLDENGKLYETASSGLFEADNLTSLPVDLDYSPEDSIYFSFLYEAGGVADNPETNDSLSLSFWAPSEEKWYNVWHTTGRPMQKFSRVMIPLTAPRFLERGFRFRFTSYASLSGVITEPSRAGNADQWNIDYILLNTGRTLTDTVYRDAAMTLPVRSLVKDYEAIPLNQFRKAYLLLMDPAIRVYYRNNDNATYSLTRHIVVTDLYNDIVVYDEIEDAENVAPLTDRVSDIPLSFNFFNVSSGDSALFLVRAFIEANETYDPAVNDTIEFLQRFSDYFAIDDGTAEAGYGINGQGAGNAMAALRFRSFLPDSVAAIDICFNDAWDNANQRSFDIMVWSDNNGAPATLLGYTEGPVAAPAEENNGFVRYYFDTPLRVTDYFWVGWRQLSETFLNAGLDLNTAHDGRQYYWLNGSWYASQAPGTVMMRAVMTGVGDGTSTGPGTLYNDLYTVFPNPTSGQITIVPSDAAPQDFIIDVYNNAGTRVMSGRQADNTDLSHLSPGHYMIIISDTRRKPLSLLRIIKTN